MSAKPEPTPAGGAAADDSRNEHLVGRLRLSELLHEVQDRLEQVVDTRDRLETLLEAMLEIGTGLDLPSTLRQVVGHAVTLAEAKYGAMGVRRADGTLSEFIVVGIDEATQRQIGDFPEGRGVLSVLLTDTLRLTDIADHPASVGFPAHHPPMKSLLGVPIRVRDSVFGQLYLTEKIGGKQFTEDDEVLVRALATAAGIAIENAELYRRSQARGRWIEAVGTITSELLSGAARSEVAELVVNSARRVFAADSAAIVVDLDGVATISVATDPELQGRDAGAAGVELSGGHVLRAPIGEDVDLPMLVVTRSADTKEFIDLEIAAFRSFADQVAIALQAANAQRDRRKLDVLGERDRIARDLHDHVIQRIFAAGLTLDGVVGRLPEGDERARLSDVTDDLQAVIEEIRARIFDLHTAERAAPDTGVRLVAALNRLTRDLPVKAVLRTSGPLSEISRDLSTAIEAVVGELVTNVVRHASAENVVVTVEVGQWVTVSVEDDGVGLGSPLRRSGLQNLADRAAENHGRFDIAARPDGGTAATWSVPLPA
ncbi:GAF domain-containing sensor histidine kinase [Jongsikchunia kroppenstedtii]|uniref:GAF domain-containing sensor histidine kinase n=1 Tax=Jongsikchunia kroppenstedtii TaxID=1121721 RepID=UPI000374296C|nr:GAF domain-containing protein [Jongsikchunia kroppenstedtii]